MLTEFEKRQAMFALKSKIHDATTLTSKLTTDCAVIISKEDTDVPTASELKTAKDAYDAVRNQPVAVTGGHTMATLSDPNLWSEINAEAAA